MISSCTRLTDDVVTLRPISDEDTENVVCWRNKDFVRKYFWYQELFTVESHTAWLRNKVETGEVVQFIISRNDLNKDIGSVFLKDFDDKEKSAEFGIFIGEEDSLSNGFGTRAAELISDYAKKVLKLEKLVLRVKDCNERAQKSYMKSGFVTDEEATANEEVSDAVIMKKQL